MTESSGGRSGTNGSKWPGPVTFNDDDPKKGYSTLFLSVPELLVNRTIFGLRKATPKNAEIYPKYSVGAVHITVKVQNKEGETVTYEYKKALPEDIDPERCTERVKNGLVEISLCKKAGMSWQQHSKYLIKRD